MLYQKSAFENDNNDDIPFKQKMLIFRRGGNWERCKKFKFDHTIKWYMHNPAPVLENATHKLLWDFNI